MTDKTTNDQRAALLPVRMRATKRRAHDCRTEARRLRSLADAEDAEAERLEDEAHEMQERING